MIKRGFSEQVQSLIRNFQVSPSYIDLQEAKTWISIIVQIVCCF
ncbi:hypothetical protein QFZ72_003048 [Bacillus sp. V2I10]|nr:hypothetical protein [Bacillus sp. V2I10]